MADKKTPKEDRKNEDKKPKQPEEEKKNTKLAAALVIAAVLILAFTLPLIIDALFIYVGYDDPGPILLMLGELEITWFVFLMTVFLVLIVITVMVIFRDMVHAAEDDRKKKSDRKIRRPKKDMDLYEEKPENRRSFGS